MSDETTRAIRLFITGDDESSISPDEVELNAKIANYLDALAEPDGFNSVFTEVVSAVLAAAIAMGVTPHAVIQLLNDNVPPMETWPRELLKEQFDA